MKEFARSFYSSKAWKSCREAYRKRVGGLCERCLRRGLYSPGEIVHHKTPLSPENIHDPKISLAFDNLELLCRNCHAAEHERASARRFKVDKMGRVTAKEDPPHALKWGGPLGTGEGKLRKIYCEVVRNEEKSGRFS